MACSISFIRQQSRESTTPAPTGICEVFGGWVTRAITGNFRGRAETLSVTNVNV